MDEKEVCPKTGKTPCKCSEKQTESFDIEDEYEYFMDSIINEAKNELFSPLAGAQNRAIEELNKLLALDMSNGANVALSLKGIIDDPKLIDKLQVLNLDAEIREEIQDYILDREPDLLNRIEFPQQGEPIGGSNIGSSTPPATSVPPAEPMPPAALPTEPAPEAPAPAAPPVAEGNSVSFSAKHGLQQSKIKKKKNKLRSVIRHAKQAGARLDTKFNFGGNEMSIREAIRECGLTQEECGFEKEGGVDQMLEFISGFYNREEQNFPLGGQRIKIKIKKDFEDGIYPDASQQDLIKVLKFIDKKDPSSAQVLETPPVVPETSDMRDSHLSELMDELNSVQRLAGLK